MERLKIEQTITQDELERRCYWFHYFWQRLEVWGNDEEYVFWNPKEKFVVTIIKKKKNENR